MKLTRLTLKHFRNFDDYELQPQARFNLITGNNGAGKTSLLESIYFLGMGRSFRTHQVQHVIKQHQKTMQVIGFIDDNYGVATVIGIEKHLDQSQSQIKMAGKNVSSLAELIRFLPLQLINHQAFSLLDAGPQNRREFLDWGVFHAEPSFLTSWQRYQRALKQRNALLRQLNANAAEFDYWEQELAQQALLITQYRTIYLDLFLPILKEILAKLLPLEDLTIQFAAGWDQDKDFQLLLKQNRVRDSYIGHTQQGVHRADLKFKIAGKDADEILSRGQQKVLSVSLHLAQGMALFRFSHKQCIYLIDDLPAELDFGRMSQVIALLAEQQSQIFISAITAAALGELVSQYEMKVFHVEHHPLGSDPGSDPAEVTC